MTTFDSTDPTHRAALLACDPYLTGDLNVWSPRWEVCATLQAIDPNGVHTDHADDSECDPHTERSAWESLYALIVDGEHAAWLGALTGWGVHRDDVEHCGAVHAAIRTLDAAVPCDVWGTIALASAYCRRCGVEPASDGPVQWRREWALADVASQMTGDGDYDPRLDYASPAAFVAAAMDPR